MSFVVCSVLPRRGQYNEKVADSRKLLAFEMRCYMRTFTVCWKDKVSNSIVRDRVHRDCTIVDVVKTDRCLYHSDQCDQVLPLDVSYLSEASHMKLVSLSDMATI